MRVSNEWVVMAARAADDKKSVDTIIIDVGDVLAITDHFVITSGNSTRQVKAIAEAIEEDVRLAGGPTPRSIEGIDSREWVLLDYGEFVVHIFLTEQRDFYQLERLWGDRPRVEWKAA